METSMAKMERPAAQVKVGGGMPSSDMKSSAPKKRKMGAGKILVAIIIIALAGSTIYFQQQAAKATKNPNAAAEQETKDLIAKVGQLIVLPENETPTIATVNDPEKLKSQPFFANAKAGDKVLIYTTAKKAILYDPSTHKIVEVAPLTIGNGTAAAPEEKKAAPAPEAPKPAATDTSKTQ